MTDLRAAAEMALEALESGWNPDKERAIAALRQAIAQPAWDASAPLVMTPHPAFAQNPLDIADRAYFAGKQAGIEETLAQGEQEPNCGIDRGAWDGVEDVTQWLEELRGNEED